MSDWTAWLAFEFELLRYDPREWLVLTGDRLLVSLLWLVLLGVAFGAAVASGLVPLRAETPVLFLLFALIGANFTLIAIVTSLSQLVIGRRLESPGEVRSKTRETIAYREDVGETIGQDVMPVKPDAFFLALYENAREELEDIRAANARGGSERAREELDALVTGLGSHADYVIDLLERPESGLKHALFTSLTADYANDVHHTWYLQTEHREEFPGQVAAPLGRLTETLKHIVVASRVFRTVFIEAEVSELSRFLLYVGLPAQLAAVLVMLLYTNPAPGSPVPHGALSVLLPVVLTAGFAPFLVLSSYVVRLTVVARRTADTFPFSSQLEGTLALADDD